VAALTLIILFSEMLKIHPPPPTQKKIQRIFFVKEIKNFTLFYLFFKKSSLAIKNDNFGEFFGSVFRIFKFFFPQFGDPQEELAKFGYSQLIFKKESCYISATCWNLLFK